ncbi:hypothetical protein C8J56DRAFT_951792, partial [Mycena floridula]
MADSASDSQLLLPGPGDVASEPAEQVEIGSVVKLDVLGPMVVNSDGTLSRIANWANLTDAEKERTVRVLSARNKIRLANEQKKLSEMPEAN